MVDIIDTIGGVTLEISPEEAEVANGYIMDMCNLQDEDYSSHMIPSEGGTIYCDGYQAVGFARIRYVGNSDFERTERQRYVITQLIGRSKTDERGADDGEDAGDSGICDHEHSRDRDLEHDYRGSGDAGL